MQAIFRIWIAGELALRETHEITHLGDLPRLAEAHSDVVVGEHRPWLAEVEIPSLPLDERFLRFGTDHEGMRQPRVLEILPR